LGGSVCARGRCDGGRSILEMMFFGFLASLERFFKLSLDTFFTFFVEALESVHVPKYRRPGIELVSIL